MLLKIYWKIHCQVTVAKSELHQYCSPAPEIWNRRLSG